MGILFSLKALIKNLSLINALKNLCPPMQQTSMYNATAIVIIVKWCRSKNSHSTDT